MNSKTVSVPFACAIAAVLVVTAGCQSPNPGYVAAGDTHFVSPVALTASEKILLAEKLCSALYVDPTFSANYQAKVAGLKKTKKGKILPVIAVQPFENNTRNGQNDSEATRQLVLEIISRLRKSGRFIVLNDQWTVETISRATAGTRQLGENGDAVQNIGEFEAPDYVMGGDLFREVDGNIYTHSLNAHITDMANRQVFWNDTFRVGKSDGKPMR